MDMEFPNLGCGGPFWGCGGFPDRAIRFPVTDKGSSDPSCGVPREVVVSCRLPILSLAHCRPR